MVKQSNKNKIGNIILSKKIEANKKKENVQNIKKNNSKRFIITIGKYKTNSKGSLTKSEKRKDGEKIPFNSQKTEENAKEIKNFDKQKIDELNPILKELKKNHEKMKEKNKIMSKNGTIMEKNKANKTKQSKYKSNKNNEKDDEKNISMKQNSNYSQTDKNSFKNNVVGEEELKVELDKDDSFDLEFQIDKDMILNNKQIWAKHLEMDLSIDYDSFMLLYENFNSINSLKKIIFIF